MAIDTFSAKDFRAFDLAGFAERMAAIRAGGSRAQRDVFHETLLEACLRSGRIDEARHILAERIVPRGDRFWRTRLAQAAPV